MSLRTAFFALLTLAVCTCAANAFSSIPKYVQDTYKEDADYKAFLTTVEGLKSKCDICHIPGADKKAKGHGLNDFGKTFHDRFKHKDFSAAHKDMKTEEATKVFKDAWEKSIKEKNKDGKVYFDLIKEGKLPGNNEPVK